MGAFSTTADVVGWATDEVTTEDEPAAVVVVTAAATNAAADGLTLHLLLTTCLFCRPSGGCTTLFFSAYTSILGRRMTGERSTTTGAEGARSSSRVRSTTRSIRRRVLVSCESTDCEMRWTEDEARFPCDRRAETEGKGEERTRRTGRRTEGNSIV